VTVVRFRDDSLVVPARVTTSDGSVAEGVKRIDRRHPLYDAWHSYCERHPEDVVERRGRLGESGEDLAEGLGASCAGLLFIVFLAGIDLLKGLGGVDLSTVLLVGGVLWVCFFIGGFVYSRRSRDRAAGRLRFACRSRGRAAPYGLAGRCMNAAKVGVVVLAGLVFLSAAPSAQARLSCSFSGPPQNLLAVTASGIDTDAVIQRSGDRIVARQSHGPNETCSGGDPTIFNTDTIVVRVPGTAEVAVRLDGGPFAPGATPEADGAPEIEFELRGGGFHRVIGTPGADEFHWGPGRTHPGLNLNPGDAADQDVDVTTVGTFSVLVADGAAGNDMIGPGPSPVADIEAVNAYGGRGDDVLTAPQNTYGVLIGGSGNDIIRGSRLGDFILFGGAGRDRIAGKDGDDRIVGGRGRDLVSGGRGPDLIKVRDSSRDIVRCGSSRDRVTADARDRLRGCEVIGP
jgi:Ca2+-binding RTX toxin-like protein